jgi:NMD protein affecting ribosome stability and mRNA decay
MPKDKPPSYFEGTLQLRDVTQEVYDWVYDTIERENRAHIAKEKVLKNGYDLYLSDNKYMRALGKRLKSKFAGELKASATLHTQSKITSKNLYRVTVMFRQLPFNIGDVIHTDHGDWKVLKVTSKVQAQDTKSGKKQMFKIEDMRRWAK